MSHKCPKHPEFRAESCYYCVGESDGKGIMKPKTIDEIVCDVIRLNHSLSNADDLIGTEEAKQQLIELFMSCVPECKPIAEEFFSGFNTCRDQMIKNLEKLK